MEWIFGPLMALIIGWTIITLMYNIFKNED